MISAGNAEWAPITAFHPGRVRPAGACSGTAQSAARPGRRVTRRRGPEPYPESGICDRRYARGTGFRGAGHDVFPAASRATFRRRWSYGVSVTMTPNATLRAVRMGMLMSQDDFARALRAAGNRAGVPNDANKRLVQRWESGAIVSPRPVYARALEAVNGVPAAQPVAAGNYSGVWLSRYEYFFSVRDASYTGLQYVLVLQHGNLISL